MPPYPYSHQVITKPHDHRRLASRAANALHSAYNHVATDRSRFSRKWHQSAFHKNTSDANRALIGVIYDAMKRFEESLAREIKKDKDEDKAMAIAASIAADPEANRDLD